MGGPKIHLHSFSYEQGGNRQDVRIAESTGDTSILNFREALLSEVFCRGWLDKDTSILSFDLNFFNL